MLSIVFMNFCGMNFRALAPGYTPIKPPMPKRIPSGLITALLGRREGISVFDAEEHDLCRDSYC